MAKKSTIEFKKGDSTLHYFGFPADSWSPGGTLFFAAKPQPDDDVTDGSAVIDVHFDDTAIIDSSHEFYDSAFVTYELEFLPDDIKNVSFADGAGRRIYDAEYQYIPANGYPETFPGNDQFLEAVIYADIKRGTTV